MIIGQSFLLQNLNNKVFKCKPLFLFCHFIIIGSVQPKLGSQKYRRMLDFFYFHIFLLSKLTKLSYGLSPNIRKLKSQATLQTSLLGQSILQTKRHGMNTRCIHSTTFDVHQTILVVPFHNPSCASNGAFTLDVKSMFNENLGGRHPRWHPMLNVRQLNVK